MTPCRLRLRLGRVFLACWVMAGTGQLVHAATVDGGGASGGSPPAPRITYFYDALDRLTGVVRPGSGAARYRYDATGNLLGIARPDPAALAVFEVTPDRA